MGAINPGKTSFIVAPLRTAGTLGELDVDVPTVGVVGVVAVGVGLGVAVAVTVSVEMTGLAVAAVLGDSSPPNTAAPTAADPPARTMAATDTRMTVRALMTPLTGRCGQNTPRFSPKVLLF
jgi:hypothetical protein